MKAKSCFLVNLSGDSITFVIHKSKKKLAEISYYYVYGNSTELVTCSPADADETYEDAIKNGYKTK